MILWFSHNRYSIWRTD